MFNYCPFLKIIFNLQINNLADSKRTYRPYVYKIVESKRTDQARGRGSWKNGRGV